MMKKLTALLLAICLLALLCACGSDSAAETASTDTVAVETAEAAEPEAAEAAESTDTAEPAATPEAGETAEPDASGERELYFETNGVQIHIWDDAQPVVDALGDPIDTFESPNCAFQGSALYYYYDGFTIELDTDEDEAQFIGSISLDDDTVATPEGVKIAMPIEDALALLGEGYTVEGSVYSYAGVGCELVLQANASGKIDSIQYTFVLEDD